MSRKGVYGPQVTEQAKKGIDLDDAGSAEVLAIEDIQVDEDYQRELRHDLVNKIAKEYDLVKAGPILVNQRLESDGGALWCVDGQHRMAGALQAGEAEIFAHVVHGLTVKEEAELRLARNDRRSDTVFEKFRTRLVMGDEKAEAVVEIVRQYGSKVNLTPDMNHGINAIVSLEALYDAGPGGGIWLGKVLKFLQEAIGEEAELGGRITGASMLKSTAWFVDRHPREAPSMREKIHLVGVDEIDRLARNHKAINGGSMWLNYYRSLVQLYNQGRQEKNKIEAKSIGSMGMLGDEGAARPNRRTVR